MKITADNMRALVQDKESGLTEILEEIRVQATNGESTLYKEYYYISDHLKEKLEDLGFNVSSGGRYNDSNTNIYW
tara:strand:+ start:2061 stop:2285 length:225 start_codon:yes stop_codon:yes gene_type:complete